MKPLPCPFCGQPPEVYPKNPEREGNAFGQVRCENLRCPATPCVNDGAMTCDERGSAAYKQLAIKRWNRRRVLRVSQDGSSVTKEQRDAS